MTPSELNFRCNGVKHRELDYFVWRGCCCDSAHDSPTQKPVEMERISQDELFEPLAGIRRSSLRLLAVAGNEHQNKKNATMR